MLLNEKPSFLLGDGCYGPICISSSAMDDSPWTTEQKLLSVAQTTRCSVAGAGSRGPERYGLDGSLDS